VYGGSLSEELRVMNTLSSRSDFFSSHEEIVRVCVVRVMRVNHSVEWTSVDGVSVQHIEISLILLTDKFSKNFLILSAKIFERVLSVSVLSQELNSVFEAQSNIFAKEGLERILITDNFEFFGKSFLETFKNVNEHLGKKIKDLKVVLFKCHFDIEACELAQVAIGV